MMTRCTVTVASMVKEVQFVERRQAEWEAWDRHLAPAGKTRRQTSALPHDLLPGSFRRLCRDLALARDRHYSAHLVESLHRRVLAAHQRVYGAGNLGFAALFGFIGRDFPQLVRREWRYVTTAALLFFVPIVLMLIWLNIQPEAVYLLLSPEQVEQYQSMYSPTARHLGRPRSASSEWAMWAFYIANNVRIDFQCFAGGVAFGVGAVFFMLYNGLMIGAVAGYLTQLGYVETFWGFVAGHSAFELIGAVLSGAAGLKLGMALIAPGERSRLAALKENAAIAVRLLYGAAGLTFLAAFIEAFWSPLRGLPFSLKIGVGIALWLLTLAYLLLAGRGTARAA